MTEEGVRTCDGLVCEWLTMSGRLWMAWFVHGPAKATWQRTFTAEIVSRAILSAC